MTFESTQPTPFCLEKSSVKNGQFNVLAAFTVLIQGWNKVKYARITITHVCFIALTLAGSLGSCRTLGLSASCSNSILGTRQILMHEKTCVIPIICFCFMVLNFLFDFADEMFHLTSAIDFGTGKEMFKMTNLLLYLSKIFRHVGLIKQG